MTIKKYVIKHVFLKTRVFTPFYAINFNRYTPYYNIDINTICDLSTLLYKSEIFH